MASYTHVGCKANVGYTHHGSRLFGHGAPRPGRRHALNGGPDRFTSLCGEAVEADTHDQYGFRREGGPANVAAAGPGAPAVTCTRCQAAARKGG